MKYRYIANDRNPKRVWPIQLPTGEVVLVPSSHWIETDHDLSAWVGSLITGGPVEQSAAPLVQPIAQEVVVEPPKDRMAAFAEAIGNAFAKPAPVVEQPVSAPVVVSAPAPIEPVVEPAAEPVVEPVAEASVEDIVEAAAEAAEGDYSALTRKALWAEVVSRGLNSGLVYNNTTKAEMIRILTAAEG